MTTGSFDFAPLLRPGLPPPAARLDGTAVSVQPEGAAGGVAVQVTATVAVPVSKLGSVPVTL